MKLGGTYRKWIPSWSAFGGKGSARGNPRSARPVATRSPMHLVLKSDLARGRHSFLARARTVDRISQRIGARCGVRIHDLAIAGNHLHFIIQPSSRKNYRQFIRGVSGVLARLMLRDGRLASLCAHRRFWEARPFTRIVRWGRDFNTVVNYLMKNRLDLIGMSREASSQMLSLIDSLREQRRNRAPPT